MDEKNGKKMTMMRRKIMINPVDDNEKNEINMNESIKKEINDEKQYLIPDLWNIVLQYLTSVVNVKVKNIRPKYDNLREWMEDPNNVYIGRHGVVFIDNERFPKQGSIFANPFTVKEYGREQVLEKYKIWLKEQIKKGKITKEQILALKGKSLGCWCHPEPCHGDVLVEFINEYSKQ